MYLCIFKQKEPFVESNSISGFVFFKLLLVKFTGRINSHRLPVSEMGNQNSSLDGLGDDVFEDAVAELSDKPKKRTRLYKHSGGLGPSSRWTPVSSQVLWKFSQIGAKEDWEETDEEAWKETIEEGSSSPDDWFLVIRDEIAAKVDEVLRVKLNDDELRVDFVTKGVWALKFYSAQEYKDFISQYRNSLFENLYGLEATEANKLKVLGKDFVGWASGEDGESSVWDAEEEKVESKAEELKVKETFRGTPSGKGVQNLTMGAMENSYLIHSSGIDVFRNRATGLEGEGFSIKLPEGLSSPSLTPTKGMLMRAEKNLMLMSPLESKLGTPGGVRQLDIETGKVVSTWQFQKDGTPISMKDIASTSKESQLDPGEFSFLGLDDNRLCRWDMREKSGIVQESPVLSWAEGHQFSRGTNFSCFAATGDGAIAVGSRDGKVRLYSTTTMRVAKTAFPGLGSPITHIDVTYDGRWVLATCDSYLLVISTVFRDKDSREKTGFQARMGSQTGAPRLLKLNPLDAHAAGPHAKFQAGHFSWVSPPLLFPPAPVLCLSAFSPD